MKRTNNSQPALVVITLHRFSAQRSSSFSFLLVAAELAIEQVAFFAFATFFLLCAITFSNFQTRRVSFGNNFVSEFVVNQSATMTSFVNIPEGSDFPLENLPYGVFSTKSNVSRYYGAKMKNFLFINMKFEISCFFLLKQSFNGLASEQECV